MGNYQDWFNGADYHHGSEQTIEIVSIVVEDEGKLHHHERVELYYVEEGEGIIEINGKSYPLRKGSFLCLYIHHFYRFAKVDVPLRMQSVRFYLGLFMFMGFERHIGDENEKLVYDTLPVQQLQKQEQMQIEQLMQQLREEQREQRFCSGNIIVYLTMQLHSLYCRYAYENRKKEERSFDAWMIIMKTLLETTTRTTLSEYSFVLGMHEATLNRQMKEKCGYTFYQLQTISKISTACSLLHFPDLNISYISDYVGFNTVQDFYRVFQRVMGQTPREFQQHQICDQRIRFAKEKLIALTQYLYLHIHEPVSIQTVAKALDLKAYTLQQLIQQHYRCTFSQLVKTIKIQLAAALLKASKQPVTSIANTLGYGSFVTFQRQFKEIMGETPSSYRNINN